MLGVEQTLNPLSLLEEDKKKKDMGFQIILTINKNGHKKKALLYSDYFGGVRVDICIGN